MSTELRESILDVLEENASCCCDDVADRDRLAKALESRVMNWIVSDKIRQLNALIDQTLESRIETQQIRARRGRGKA